MQALLHRILKRLSKPSPGHVATGLALPVDDARNVAKLLSIEANAKPLTARRLTNLFATHDVANVGDVGVGALLDITTLLRVPIANEQWAQLLRDTRTHLGIPEPVAISCQHHRLGLRQHSRLRQHTIFRSDLCIYIYRCI